MNPELKWAIAIGSATLAWNLYGFAGNFFEHYWGGSGRPVTFISFLANALLLAAIALAGIKQLAGSRALAFAGLVMAVWSLVGAAVEVAVAAGQILRASGLPALNLPEPPPFLGAAVPMITGAITAALAWRAARRGLT